ncbi:hypothetical protein DENSPDRAFT_925636 [Dentipellis sp. KUC8613]|nr:hypothetical protein DENSPDRAFT_925636 [Dentipellis sp. KUC8613]
MPAFHTCIRAAPLRASARAGRMRFSSSARAREEAKKPSPHASFYSELVPGMIPIAILGSAVYLGLQLARSRLSHEKYLDEARVRIEQLEGEVDALRAAQGQERLQGGAPSGAESGAPKSKGWFGSLSR